jgi:hypothetical protein
MLDCMRTVLLTNNRAKLYGFTKTGIEIASRMPLEVPINADNRRYMTVKAVRAGHRAVRPADHSTFGLRSSCERAELMLALALQLPFLQISESMGNHDSKIVDAASVD